MYFLLAQDPTDGAWEVAVAEIESCAVALSILQGELDYEKLHPEAVKFHYVIVAKVSLGE